MKKKSELKGYENLNSLWLSEGVLYEFYILAFKVLVSHPADPPPGKRTTNSISEIGDVAPGYYKFLRVVGSSEVEVSLYKPAREVMFVVVRSTPPQTTVTFFDVSGNVIEKDAELPIVDYPPTPFSYVSSGELISRFVISGHGADDSAYVHLANFETR